MSWWLLLLSSYRLANNQQARRNSQPLSLAS
nr:MAG TPA: hypothetical protein [Caudoviricetes sp.]